MVHYKLSLVLGFPFFIVLFASHMVHYKLSLVLGFPFFIVLFASHMVHYKLLLVWGFLFFIVFIHIAYGPLQTLASVELAQARPNNYYTPRN